MDATQLPGAGVVTATAETDLIRARDIASTVVDPEIPVLSVADLGILRDVEVRDGRVTVTITPTYSGCPAMRQIEHDLKTALGDAGFADVEVRMVHSPAWSSEWITPEGRRRLASFGIAPPGPLGEVLCPRCASGSPRMVARFGSTACKALMVCTACGEPFDFFKEF
jgi:ring-1,2-phenylacetyl-CoA epoxidase subunit PaaD